MDDNLDGDEPIDLRRYIALLKEQYVVIIITLLLGVGVALLYSFLRGPTYQATASVLVPEQQAASGLSVQGQQLQSSASMARYLADQESFAKGDAVKNLVDKKLGYSPTVNITPSTTADVLEFQGSSGNRLQAVQASNAYAQAYISAFRTAQISQYSQQVTALDASIQALKDRQAKLAAGDPQIATIQQSIDSLTQTVEQAQAATELAGEIGPTLLDAATPPKGPSSPKISLDIGLGALLGVVLGLILAFVRDRFDDRVKSRDAASDATGGLPIVALLPEVPTWRSKGAHHLAIAEEPDSQAAESFRTFRTALQFLTLDRLTKVIGVTSPLSAEGKTTTVANLALSFARTGQKVIVVSGDLRRPRIHQFFGSANSLGLTSVLIGEAELREAVTTVPDEPWIRLLCSGPVPPNPAEVLAADGVDRIFERLRQSADVVLLDCPPVLPVSDTLALSRLVDGMLILASAERTSRRDLRRAMELLNQVKTPMLGIVINGIPDRAHLNYGAYGYDGYSSSDEQANPIRPIGLTQEDGPVSQPDGAEHDLWDVAPKSDHR